MSERFFYLVDTDTDRPIVRFPYGYIGRHLDRLALEAQIRVRFNVDDPASGILLRDSELDPLEPGDIPPVHRDN